MKKAELEEENRNLKKELDLTKLSLMLATEHIALTIQYLDEVDRAYGKYCLKSEEIQKKADAMLKKAEIDVT